MNLTISRPQKIKAQPGGEAESSPACAIGAFIVFVVKNPFKISDLAWVKIYIFKYGEYDVEDRA
jgi:hypothetical protein